jgi:hypothetical protein
LWLLWLLWLLLLWLWLLVWVWVWVWGAVAAIARCCGAQPTSTPPEHLPAASLSKFRVSTIAQLHVSRRPIAIPRLLWPFERLRRRRRLHQAAHGACRDDGVQPCAHLRVHLRGAAVAPPPLSLSLPLSLAALLLLHGVVRFLAGGTRAHSHQCNRWHHRQHLGSTCTVHLILLSNALW